MRRFNDISCGDFELTLAKRDFIKEGRYSQYIDLLFKKSSKSIVLKRTPVDKGVSYKADMRTYEIDDQEYQQELEVAGFHHICCLDWDWQNEGHKTELCVTISNYQDVKQRLEAHGETWRTYITPGGVRAFCVSRAYHPEVMPKLDADPLFIELCKKTKTFWFRVVPKAERSYDWVAHYIETIGDKPVDLALTKMISLYHDKQIVINRGYAELNLEQLDMIKEKR